LKPLHIATLLFFTHIISSCTSVPKEQYWQFLDRSWAKYDNDTLTIYLSNPLRCPLRFKITSSDAALSERLKPVQNVMLAFAKDTLIKVHATQKQAESVLIHHGFGNPQQEINPVKFTLPFLPGSSYTVIQGYNGSFSHRDAYSKYAIDFNLQQGDTVCAAEDGYVVGVIRNYKEGGNSKKWRDYANFITIYHPHSGLYTQYAHLMQNGSLVDVGDFVRLGDPIGLAGKTGWTNIQHLHFNVLRPVESGEWLESYPADYMEGYNGQGLKQGDTVIKPPL
jgi:murein DD-endopeptidase MepM/ murein hydrolase activator NlpD